ncbi:hypothetical protein TRV_02273 [Trichophyton verrucosum HKI 0517]|uniref:F-box domain-containing protein n=1 Tax=Trichophyton verrucosum (strain HKI 0517) TaxID=663202 RepID=D4D5A3_TRIVH|nr:uncharacterized protein TRV_02273 [Trichophyton verrucosum HKI 0517]EFE42908.1 hypothetical protein TRV_02273 [Trichophyton verrucosum HKI 0517]
MDPASEHSWSLFQYIRELLAAPEKHTHDWSEAERHNFQHSPLYRLPAELLGIIHEYLPPNNSFALSLTCARFYFSTILAGAQRELKSTKMGQFIVMCMLEGVGQIKEYCCRGCLTTHPSSHFSKDELEKRHAERYCLRTKKVMAFGAFGSDPKSFNEVLEMRRTRELEENIDILQQGSFWNLFSSPKISVVTGIRLFPQGKKVSVERFAELCQKLNYPVCPHMTTADKRIVDLYVPDFFRAGKSNIPYPFSQHFERNELGVKCKVYEAANSFYYATQAPIAGTAIESNIDCIPLSLPKSSLMTRLGVTIWSAVSSCIPEKHHRRKSGHLHRVVISDHLYMLTPQFQREREGRD